jgi:CTP:molybdopterin cytidylyltransferase MocA
LRNRKIGPHSQRSHIRSIRMHDTPAILILAAGQSRRMRGADKLLEMIDGRPQLRRVAMAALETSAQVWVALPPDRPERTAALQNLPLKTVAIADAARGMAASLRGGAAMVPRTRPLLVVLADLPEITPDDLRQMLAAHLAAPQMILRATNAVGQPGHPVLFPAWARPMLDDITGDSGARALLQAHPEKVCKVVLPDNHATTDLDTPEDWAQWRAARKNRD